MAFRPVRTVLNPHTVGRPEVRAAVLNRPRLTPSTLARDPQAIVPPLGTGFLVFCVYTFVLVGRPQDYVPLLVPLRLALVFTGLTALVTLFRQEKDADSIFRFSETKLYFCLFAVMCAGIPFSLYPGLSFDYVILTYTASMAFYVMFVIHVNTLAKFRRIVVVLTLAGLMFSAVGLLQGNFTEGRYSTGSQMFDPNDVAFIVISLLPFELCALLGTFSALTRMLGLAGLLLSVLLGLLTGSRGGLIGLGIALLLFLILPIHRVKGSHKAIVAAFLAVIALAGLSSGAFNVDRYATLTDLGNDYNSFDETGRVQIWTRGLKLLAENPLTGVGVGEFGEAIGTMRMNEGLQEVWQAPHNSYIQILTETGVGGGTAFFLLIGACLRTFTRLRRSAVRVESDMGLDVLPGILLLGFIGELVTAFFLSQAYSMSFTLFFAASASLKRIAASVGPIEATPSTVTSPISRRVRSNVPPQSALRH